MARKAREPDDARGYPRQQRLIMAERRRDELASWSENALERRKRTRQIRSQVKYVRSNDGIE